MATRANSGRSSLSPARRKRPHRPQRGAAVEAERAEGVGLGEAFERGGLQPRAQPKVANGIEARAAGGLDRLAIVLGKSADLAKAEPHRMGGADVVLHLGMARV